MWVRKQAPDFLNPAFKSVSTWTNIFVIGVFVKFRWLKQRGKTLGANWSPPTWHRSTSGSINVSNMFVFSSSHSHLFLLVRSYRNKSHMLVCGMHDGQLRLCGGLRVYGVTPLPVVSVLPGCSSPWEQTHAGLHHFCYLIQQRVCCRLHTCSLGQETSMRTGQGFPLCTKM